MGVGLTPIHARCTPDSVNNTCTPDAGFQYCDTNTSTLLIDAKMQIDLSGNDIGEHGGYWLAHKAVYDRVKCAGSLYRDPVGNPPCTVLGCTGTLIGKNGTFTVERVAAPADKVPEVTYLCFQTYLAKAAWTTRSLYGLSDMLVTDCFTDEQCGSGRYCDKSSNDAIDWTCKSCQ